MTNVYNTHGWKSRVLVGDGSAATYQDLVEAGIVELYDYTVHEWPISTLEQLAEGAWPADPADPKCPFISVAAQEKAGDMRTRNLGITCIEGLTVAGEYIMGDALGGFANRAAKGERIGGESEIRLIDGEFNTKGDLINGSGRAYGGHTQSHYGQGQDRLANVIERSKAFRRGVIWTAHEGEAESSGEKIIGPRGVGNKGTGQFSKKFGNTLHFTKAEKVVKRPDPFTGVPINQLELVYRIYTRDHYKPEGKVFGRYLAVSRIKFPEMLPDYLESNTPGESIMKVYDIIEASVARAKSLHKAPVLEVA